MDAPAFYGINCAKVEVSIVGKSSPRELATAPEFDRNQARVHEIEPVSLHPPYGESTGSACVHGAIASPYLTAQEIRA
jgi:hypothetical protein